MAKGWSVDRDRGYRALLLGLAKLAEEPYVTLGIHEDEGRQRDGDGPTVAEYATFNEFGMGVPERSFLRSTVDEHRDEIARRLETAITDQLDGRRTVGQGLERLGLWATGRVKMKIRDLRDPPNAPRTIALKGSDNPLIDTGRMRNSIAYKVRGLRAWDRK